jgi:hypothetical protein
MERKLYVLAKCSICLGKHIGCRYCDRDGLSYVEAADSILKEWFDAQIKERQKEILSLFREKNE